MSTTPSTFTARLRQLETVSTLSGTNNSIPPSSYASSSVTVTDDVAVDNTNKAQEKLVEDSFAASGEESEVGGVEEDPEESKEMSRRDVQAIRDILSGIVKTENHVGVGAFLKLAPEWENKEGMRRSSV